MSKSAMGGMATRLWAWLCRMRESSAIVLNCEVADRLHAPIVRERRCHGRGVRCIAMTWNISRIKSIQGQYIPNKSQLVRTFLSVRSHLNHAFQHSHAQSGVAMPPAASPSPAKQGLASGSRKSRINASPDTVRVSAEGGQMQSINSQQLASLKVRGGSCR